ncbi:magnesium transporter [Azospirillum sp. TSH100]|uniref:magnesium transporter n=1 Tax=Azospirillum sp. TSH100 TaxID=652764 RepID=UPI000D60F0C9|nr:magnesium transporter [Azospirillum sp. TSH100]PWC88796.1 magnesium transporter [Azospirillum sp. TSH100]QCG86735.1 magnesium transporter [Azospirillum sp. TSH100]
MHTDPRTPDPRSDLEPDVAAQPQGNPHEAEDERRYGVEPDFVEEIAGLLRARERDAVLARLNGLHAADIADLIEQAEPAERADLIDLLPAELDGEVLSYLNPDLRESLIGRFEPQELADAVADLDTDDAVELIEDLDAETRAQILAKLPDAERALVQENLTYDEDSAGRMMQRELVAVPEFWTVGKTIDFVRAATDTLPEDFYDIFIVDPMHRVVGAVPLSRLLRQRRAVRIADLVTGEVDAIPATMEREEVANLFRQYALVSAPVVDAAGRLIGVITVDDVVRIIDEEAEDDLRKLSGSGDTGVFSGIADIARSRVGWLTVNLATAFLASGVISLFEGTIEQIVALAVLMPIVASMGGNAGTQTLAVVVRALATHELSSANALRVVGKELLVGLINGGIFAVMVGLIALVWYGPLIGVVIGLAMIINLVVAGLSGALIPLGLEKLGVDPAVSSAVFLTTVTDVVGFLAFLGLASVFLL